MRNHFADMLRTLPDTPPVDVSFKAGLLACGSKHSVQPSRSITPQWTKIEQMLAAYSCGGSYGITSPSWCKRTVFPS
jgi:hypothetical protein